MANVSVIQRHAHLAGAVKLEFVNGREGKIAYFSDRGRPEQADRGRQM